MTTSPIFAPLPAAGHNSGDRSQSYDQIAHELAAQGWCVVRDFFDPQLLMALRLRLEELAAAQALSPAGIGRGADNLEDRAIRRDDTQWLERQNDVEIRFLNEMETLRSELNQRLMLGLFFFEAHFATYRPGAFYKRHLDSFRGRRNRLISTVLYLNPNWQAEHGGLLAFYADEESATPFMTVLPEMGTFVLFLSEELPHEVQPALASRASIAGWFRCNDKQCVPALQWPTPASPLVS